MLPESRADWFRLVVEGLSTTFQLDPSRITPEARIYDDLDIDSIDAVDLAARLQKDTGLRLSPEVFKAVRTVDDLVNALAAMTDGALAGGAAARVAETAGD